MMYMALKETLWTKCLHFAESKSRDTGNQRNAETGATELMSTIKSINPKVRHCKVQNGSLVLTNRGNYFIGIGAGDIEIEGTDFVAIDVLSELAQQMSNHWAGEEVEVHGQAYRILEVW